LFEGAKPTKAPRGEGTASAQEKSGLTPEFP